MSNRTIFTCRETNLNLWRLWGWMRRFLKLIDFFLIKKYNFIMTICLLNNFDYILGAFYFIGICELFFFLDINVFCSRCWMSRLYVLNFGSYYFRVGLVKQWDCLQVIAVEPVSDLKLNSRILQVLLFFSWSYMKSFCAECFSLSLLLVLLWQCRIQYLKKSMEIPKLDGKLPWTIIFPITLWVFNWQDIFLYI
jgi:hypothetical protein